MAHAFIIMQIGNANLDKMCAEVIVPALKACGFEQPKRVDKHNEGGLLKSEIIGFIEQAGIIVADLTNERPNCYLEVGYAMGVDKFKNLILTAREDHNQDSPTHILHGPKVHFDLSGYDVCFWSPDNLPAFRDELEKRVRRRMAIIKPPSDKPAPAWDEDWLKTHKFNAREGLKNAGMWKTPGLTGLTEIQFALADFPISKVQSELLRAAEEAQIHTFGWPIGVVLHTEQRPRPVSDGIVAAIPAAPHSYDYWALRKNGDFYLLQTLFEDKHRPGQIFFDTRIVRITEALLYCARLYTVLGVTDSARVHFGVRHSGLKGRVLTSAVHADWRALRSVEDEIYSEADFPLSSVDSRIVAIVRQLLQPLFELFDFFHPSDDQYAAIVNDFVKKSSQ